MSDFYRWDPQWVAAFRREIGPAIARADAVRTPRTEAEDEALFREIMDAPVDPDLELIHDYLDVAMTAEEMASVEDRLATDEEFRRKVTPIIWLWENPVPLIAKPDIPPPSDGEITEIGPTEPLNTTIRGLTKTNLLTIGALLVFGAWAGREMWKSSQHQVQVTQDLRGGRASTIAIVDPEVFTTNALGRETIEVVPGVVVQLGPMSRLTRDHAEYIDRDVLLAIDGDATIEIEAPATRVRVETPAAYFRLKPGRYAVRSPPGAVETLVHTYDGTVMVGPNPGAPYTDHFMAIRKTGAPRIAPDSTGFRVYHNISR